MDWYDRAVEEVERELDAGHITQEEYHKVMRELRYDLEGAAEEAAETARRDVMGEW